MIFWITGHGPFLKKTSPNDVNEDIIMTPGAPLTYFNDGLGGRGRDFFGSEILAKTVIFLGL